MICGSNRLITRSAAAWSSGVEPAHASVATVTLAPASAAARAVAMTQQSVETPVTTSRGVAPTISRRAAPHLPNVGSVTTCAPAASDASSGTTAYKGSLSSTRAKGHRL